MNRSIWMLGLLTIWWLTMPIAAGANSDSELHRLREENNLLKIKLKAVVAELDKLKGLLKQQQQKVHVADPTSSSLANSLLRQTPTSEIYDEQKDISTVATKYVRFGSGGLLPLKRLLRLAYTYRGQAPGAPVDSITLSVVVGQPGLFSDEVTVAQINIDGNRMDLPVSNHHIDRKRRSVGRKRTVQEQHRFEIPLSRQQIGLIANANRVVLTIGGEPFPLVNEQVTLFAGIDARITLQESQIPLPD